MPALMGVPEVGEKPVQVGGGPGGALKWRNPIVTGQFLCFRCVT